MRSTAFVAPLVPGKESELLDFVGALQRRSSVDAATQQVAGLTREALFLQRTPLGAQVILYREFASGSGDRPALMGRLAVITGVDGRIAEPPSVEQLLREFPPLAGGELHAFAVPLAPGKTDRLREFVGELTGIHAQEYADSLRRLGVGVTLFLQRSPDGDLLITILEGLEPATALGRMVTSEHPFERWHVQQIADLHGIDLSQTPPPATERLISLPPCGAGLGWGVLGKGVTRRHDSRL